MRVDELRHIEVGRCRAEIDFFDEWKKNQKNSFCHWHKPLQLDRQGKERWRAREERRGKNTARTREEEEKKRSRFSLVACFFDKIKSEYEYNMRILRYRYTFFFLSSFLCLPFPLAFRFTVGERDRATRDTGRTQEKRGKGAREKSAA